MRVFSFGGGVQSVAVLVLVVQGRLHYDALLFSNVGDDSEDPETLTYFRQYALPYAQEHSVQLEELRRTWLKGPKKGEEITLYENATGPNRTIPVPARMSGNGAPGRRNCTKEFKIDPVARWMKGHGMSKENPGVLGLGITVDEIERARTDSGIPNQNLEYPLIDLGLSRDDCIAIIEESPIPVPPKSACWFCPMKKRSQWYDMSRERPDLFDRAVAFEEKLNHKRAELGRDPVYLHSALLPLDEAVELYGPAKDTGAADCESGYCMA